MKKTVEKIIILFSLGWLISLFSFGAGIYIYSQKKWPYPIIEAVQKFVGGHSEEKTSLAEKIENDLGLVPNRQIVVPKKKYTIPDTYKTLHQLPLKKRRNEPLYFLSQEAPKGYRLIYGVFDFEKSLHGAVLLDPDGNVHNIWHLGQSNVDWKHQPDENIFPHGFVIAPDGSIVTAYDSGTSLTKYDFCGNVVWRIKGGFHHSISFEGPLAIWTWGDAGADKPYGNNLIKVDYETGEVLKTFHMDDILAANPDIDIFGILQEDTVEGSKWIGHKAGGRWHVNDIDPLPEAFADHYPGFNPGDLLLSLRSPDLICVIDQNTLKVKWWRQGLTRRQHDPDWNSKGTITIFNNNMHKGLSNIVELNPETYEYNHVVRGEPHEFYTWIRGKHQRLENDGYLITSTQQGRVFEINGQGEITFEFINIYDEEKGFLAVSEAVFLPIDYFKELPKCRK